MRRLRWGEWSRRAGVLLGLTLFASCGETSESPPPLPPLRCIGTIWYCGIVPRVDCDRTPGCSWATPPSRCASTLRCNTQGNEEQCDGAEGCHWLASTPSTCTGEPTPCRGLRPDLCAIEGCSSAPACATPCDGLPEDACENRDECAWQTTTKICARTVPPLSGPCAERAHDECIENPADGCLWSDAFCEGTPKPCSALTTFVDCSGAHCSWTEGTGVCVPDPEPCASQASSESCNAMEACAWNEGSCSGILDCTRVPVEQCERLPNCSLKR